MCFFFLLGLCDIVENFQEGDVRFWSDLVFIDFERKFKCHGVKDGSFEAMNFGKIGSHSINIFRFSVGSHCAEVLKSAEKWEWRYFERR